MERRKIAIVGVGLIGGSLALQLREKEIASHIYGVDINERHRVKALELGIVDKMLCMEEALTIADCIILAIPVDAMISLLPDLLDRVGAQIVVDTGSTKLQLVDITRGHHHRGRYVATHPMWGTENSGPEAAERKGLENRTVVICNSRESDGDAVEYVEAIYRRLGMHILHMPADAHDLHTAYISHISHITSFALANTVLEKEKEEDKIFALASGGFESTVRLAKSNPEMWLPIFRQNRDNILDVLNEHIHQLRKFKSCLERENYTYLQQLIENANAIRRIIK